MYRERERTREILGVRTGRMKTSDGRGGHHKSAEVPDMYMY